MSQRNDADIAIHSLDYEKVRRLTANRKKLLYIYIFIYSELQDSVNHKKLRKYSHQTTELETQTIKIQ